MSAPTYAECGWCFTPVSTKNPSNHDDGSCWYHGDCWKEMKEQIRRAEETPWNGRLTMTIDYEKGELNFEDHPDDWGGWWEGASRDAEAES